jgi:RHS repeat-associated protein
VLVTSDGYCINGNRLRVTSAADTYGLAGSTYQTEIADFSQITAYGTEGNGPSYFIVQARNGLTYYYGDSASSMIVAAGSSPSTALTWLLNKVVDRNGNSYVITYTTLSGAVIGTAVPSTISWGPTTAGGSTYNYTMQFNYSSNVPQSSVNKYVAGTQVYNPKLISSIEILYGSSTVVKDYFLSYSGSPTTAREELTQIQECPNTTQSSSNCLAPTTITYGGPTKGVSSTAETALSSGAKSGLTARYDLNGDGIPDLVYSNGTTWYVSFGSQTGYGTPVSTGIAASATVLPGNLNGGTQDGLLATNGSTWYYYTWNGAAFAGTSTGLAFDSSALQYQLADVNGDGLPDLVSLYLNMSTYAYSVDTRLNTTSGTSVSFSSTLTTAYSSSIATYGSVWLQPPDSQFGKLRRYDFNGDGRDDVVLATQTTNPKSGVLSTSVYELLSTGSAFVVGGAVGFNANIVNFPFFVNWNDDACTDYVFNNTLYISGCNGSIPTTVPISGTVLAGIDWDGDGRTDLLVQNGSDLGVYLSTASSTLTLTTTTIPYSASCQYLAMNASGTGMDDLGCWGASITYYPHNGIPDLATEFKDGYGNSVSPTYLPMTNSSVYTKGSNARYPYENYIGPLYLVNQATFSDPSTTSGSYHHSYAYFWGWMNLQGRGFSGFDGGMTDTDSRTGVNTYPTYGVAFPYTGMLNEVWTSQPNTGSVFTSKLTNTFAEITLDSTSNNQRYFPYVQNSTTLKYELGGTENGDLITTTSTNYTYDNYGNATTIATTVTDNDPNPADSAYSGKTWTTTTTNTTDISVNQSADLAQWCLTMLDETQVTYSSSLSGSASVTRTKTFTPDTPNECRIKGIVTEPTANSGLYKVAEALTFDSFGNVATDTLTGATMPSSPASRESQLNWGATGQFLTTLTDPSGAITTWTYTSNQALTFGVPDSQKDANGLTTSWVYDAFGRKTGETRPDGTSTGWVWSLCTSYCNWSNSVYQIAQTAYQTNGTTVIRTDTSSYDPIDRVTQTAGPTVTGTTAMVQKLYNSLGLLTQQSMPFLSGGTAYQQTFAYDVLHRPTSATRPISSTNSNPQTTSFGYAGRISTVTDPYGNTKTTVTDVNGWLRQAKDEQTPTPYTVTRAYDSAGSLTGITDSVGNTLLKNVTVVYGIKPFITAATDADRGAWTYTIDSLGEKTSWTDAKGQSFSMSYDALSRPLSRTEPDLFTNWNYGSAAPNWGRLTSECTQSASTANLCTTSGSSWLYNEFYTYDGLSRLSARTIVQSGNTGGNDGGGAFVYTLAYSATTGLLNTLTYPKSTSGFALTLQYGYGYGLLQSITDTSDTTATCGNTCVLWTANATNGFGEVIEETLGNGVVTNRSYDAVTSWLTAATAGVGGGSGLLNQSYLEDENGNITQRQNNTLGLTESFFYDKDYRLSCATLSSSCSTPTFVYDGGSAGPGNITTEVGVGTYTYPAAGQPRPHAVTSLTGTFNGITNPTFSYDANGNMTDRASSTANITWSSYNYPIAISASDVTGSEEVQFNYDPSRRRWEQIYTGPSGTEQTYYVGNQLEVVFNGTTNYRHYIYAGSEPVAVYSRTSAGVNTMSYILEDHQGGVSAITSNAGIADIQESFSAFGARRNPTTWSGAPTTSDLATIASLSRQGYTFQTWLGQSMGLNHMNGRVEDAILGRMLSPDPHIPDPTNAQSYNRYSYVNNNPLTMVDPTGFHGHKCQGCGNFPGPVNWPTAGGGGGDGGGGDGSGDPGGGDSDNPYSPDYFNPNYVTPVDDDDYVPTAFDDGFGDEASGDAATQLGSATLGFADEPSYFASLSDPEMAEADAYVALSQHPALALFAAVAPFSIAALPDIAAPSMYIYWNGGEVAQAAANAYAASTGGQTVAVAADATIAEIDAASAVSAANASGNAVVFQTASFGGDTAVSINAAASTWARVELNGLMANPNVTGITWYILNGSGATVCSVICTK